MEKLTKPEINLLERLFEVEYSSNPYKVYQPKRISKALRSLIDRGFAEQIEFNVGSISPVPAFAVVHVRGYAITLLGHYTYCQYASSVYKEEV